MVINIDGISLDTRVFGKMKIYKRRLRLTFTYDTTRTDRTGKIEFTFQNGIEFEYACTNILKAIETGQEAVRVVSSSLTWDHKEYLEYMKAMNDLLSCDMEINFHNIQNR